MPLLATSEERKPSRMTEERFREIIAGANLSRCERYILREHLELPVGNLPVGFPVGDLAPRRKMLMRRSALEKTGLS